MKATILYTALVSSAVSIAVTLLVTMTVMPGVVDAQVARTTAAGLTGRAGGWASRYLLLRSAQLAAVCSECLELMARLSASPSAQLVLHLDNRRTLSNVVVDLFCRGRRHQNRSHRHTSRNVPSSPIGVAFWDPQGHVRYRTTLDADGNLDRMPALRCEWNCAMECRRELFDERHSTRLATSRSLCTRPTISTRPKERRTGDGGTAA